MQIVAARRRAQVSKAAGWISPASSPVAASPARGLSTATSLAATIFEEAGAVSQAALEDGPTASARSSTAA